MTQKYHNPFSGMDLLVPVEQHSKFYQKYCQTGDSALSIDQSPFPRMVDFWFAGLSLAAREGLEPKQLTKGETSNKIAEGSIFDSDNWRVQAIMLVAIAVKDDVQIVDHPRRIMDIANGLAASGIAEIVEMLCEGNQPPIWNFSEALYKVLKT